MTAVIRTVTTAEELRGLLDVERAAGRSVGFVPTMGYLHDGHASLIRAAAAVTDVVVASVFVNPLQFAPTEDLAAYPRDLDGDLSVAAPAGCELVFVPSEDEMYPDGRDGVLSTVSVPALAAVMEGASRPTHFPGVCTVVAKLFTQVRPDFALFGEKDYQQLKVVTRMAADLDLGIRIIPLATIREADGLAMSSRNRYLSDEHRALAPLLQRVMQDLAARIRNRDDLFKAVADAQNEIITAGFELDYLEARHAETLAPVASLADGPIRLILAARIGSTRLLDNIAV